MQVHAIYDNGRLIFDPPVRLKYASLEVEVIIPESAIATSDGQESAVSKTPPSPASSGSGIRQQFDAILGRFAGCCPAASPDQDKAV
jgi:hypothetical protein